MTSQEYIREVQRVRAQLREERPKEVLRIAFDLIQDVKRRIQQSGQNYEGSPFEDYNPVYAKYGRREKGYQAEYVDFTRTGRMWASVIPEITSNTATETEVTIRSSNAGDQVKIDGAERKRGNILRPNDQEIETARLANIDRIERILKPIL